MGDDRIPKIIMDWEAEYIRRGRPPVRWKDRVVEKEIKATSEETRKRITGCRIVMEDPTYHSSGNTTLIEPSPFLKAEWKSSGSPADPRRGETARRYNVTKQLTPHPHETGSTTLLTETAVPSQVLRQPPSTLLYDLALVPSVPLL
ncbi:unnamed protein product [Nezara viridula]|uniref:Uncharacterized protein n=1 Tax=Nezara viridula TaxID=85310 RepID=A0A9P0MTG4_NEZVI|nr:unnamed protein product [Nezara viridula]